MTATVAGYENRVKGMEAGTGAFLGNAGFNWAFNERWSMGAFYTIEAREDQTIQSGNLTLRLSF